MIFKSNTSKETLEFGEQQQINKGAFRQELYLIDQGIIAMHLKVVVGHQILLIQEHAFYYNIYLKVAIFPKVQQIQSSAFYGCSSLRLFIGDELKIVEGHVFYLCSLLIQVRQKLEKIGICAFGNCVSLENLDVENVKLLDWGAFMNCYLFKRFKNQFIEMIPTNCFANCLSLVEIDAENVKQIEVDALKNCYLIEKLILPSLKQVYACKFYFPALKEIQCNQIIQHVVNVESNAFILQKQFNYLIKVQKSSLKFSNLYDDIITQIPIGIAYQIRYLTSSTKIAPNRCFMDSHLIKAVLPNCTILQYMSFVNSFRLKTIEAPNLEILEACCLFRCHNLQQIKSKNIKTIGIHALAYCYNLQKIQSQKINEIQNSAFCEDFSFQSKIKLDIPKELNVFDRCYNLQGDQDKFDEQYKQVTQKIKIINQYQQLCQKSQFLSE